jgi:hypothetical protein
MALNRQTKHASLGGINEFMDLLGRPSPSLPECMLGNDANSFPQKGIGV